MREPRPDWSPLGVNFKILDEHPYFFYISSPPPPPPPGNLCLEKTNEDVAHQNNTKNAGAAKQTSKKNFLRGFARRSQESNSKHHDSEKPNLHLHLLKRS